MLCQKKWNNLILKIIKVNPDILVGLIFIILGLEMLISLKKEEQLKILTGMFSVVFFAFTVSIDSFSIGIGFGISNINILLPCIIFSIEMNTTYIPSRCRLKIIRGVW